MTSKMDEIKTYVSYLTEDPELDICQYWFSVYETKVDEPEILLTFPSGT